MVTGPRKKSVLCKVREMSLYTCDVLVIPQGTLQSAGRLEPRGPHELLLVDC